MALPDEAQTRVEQYLSRIATGSGDIPDEPMTRLEQYLAYIAENGGSGGGGTTLTDDQIAAINSIASIEKRVAELEETAIQAEVVEAEE